MLWFALIVVAIALSDMVRRTEEEKLAIAG